MKVTMINNHISLFLPLCFLSKLDVQGRTPYLKQVVKFAIKDSLAAHHEYYSLRVDCTDIHRVR